MANFIQIDNRIWINSDKVLLFYITKGHNMNFGKTTTLFTFIHEDNKSYSVEIADDDEANRIIKTLEGKLDENNKQA